MALTIEERTSRKEARKAAREAENKAARIQAERDQNPVRQIGISIEWRKSRTWGSNPHLTAEVWFKDGTWRRIDGITASGCGYDKESTVVAEVYNMLLKYRLWEFHDAIVDGTYIPQNELPYGIYIRPAEDGREAWINYNGGVGMSCYYPISEFIGGKLERVASGKTYDAYKFTMNE